ncbi:MAG: hypothetical protein WEB53_09770 [Akkermansiaceae bacterium]
MTIGLDLDNTIVCYDRCFHLLATERHGLPGTVRAEKNAVRQYFRESGREADWTVLQGIAYGQGMTKAEPFAGALDFVREAVARGHTVKIISHRTRQPIVGDATDLHASALAWLKCEGFVGPGALAESDVFFETSKEAKLQRIAEQQCAVFLDDLPEILLSDHFPVGVQGWLFAPGQGDAGYDRTVADWETFGRYIL